MKSLRLILPAGFFLGLFCFMFSSCTKDIDPDLLGTWSRYHNFDGTAYEVELTFTSDGILRWDPVSDIPGHTASEVNYETNRDGFRIFNDDECGSEAQYSYTFSMSSLSIMALSDDCMDRQTALTGEWEMVH